MQIQSSSHHQHTQLMNWIKVKDHPLKLFWSPAQGNEQKTSWPFVKIAPHPEDYTIPCLPHLPKNTPSPTFHKCFWSLSTKDHFQLNQVSQTTDRTHQATPKRLKCKPYNCLGKMEEVIQSLFILLAHKTSIS